MNGEMKQFANMVSFLGDTLGPAFMAVLYDMTDPEYPVIASANASADDQESLRELAAKAVRSPRTQAEPYFANHAVSVDYTKMLKASVFFVRGGENEVPGALCLAVQCNLFLKMHSFASSMLQFSLDDFEGPEPPEPAAASRGEPTLDSIEEIVQEFGIEPGRVSLNERMEIMVELYEMGVYHLKGAVARTAEALQISEQSVYRYLSKIKRARGD